MSENGTIKLDFHFIRWLVVGCAFIWLYHTYGITDLVSFDSLWLFLGIEFGWFMIQVVFWVVVAIVGAVREANKVKRAYQIREVEEYELVDDD